MIHMRWPAVALTCCLKTCARTKEVHVGVNHFLQEDRGPKLANVVLEFIRYNPIH